MALKPLQKLIAAVHAVLGSGIAGRSFSHGRRHLQRAYPTAMIWPVQKTGLPYNIVRFPNGPRLAHSVPMYAYTSIGTEDGQPSFSQEILIPA